MNFMKQIKTREEQPKMDKGMHRPSKEAGMTIRSLHEEAGKLIRVPVQST